MKWKLKAVFGAWVLLLAGSCQKSAPFYQNTVVPFSFEENRGQADPAVHFFAQTDRYAVFLAEREVVIAPRHSPGQAFRMRFIDGQPARISALEPTGQTSNYLIGNDPRLWKKGVQHFARVRYENVYPDTDLVFYSESGQFRYDFVLKPGANPDNIRFAVEDAAQLGLSHAGDLVIQGDSGEFRFGPPVVYQMAENRRERVEGFYRLMAGNVVAFDVARYDGTRSLVIDPTLTYSTLLGGTGGETPVAIAVDSAGNAYIVGRTDSVDFPTTSGALKPSRPDFQNTVRNYTFITKMNAQGSGILYSTYIGSDANTRTPTAPRAIAVDSEGNAYITGTATGEDLPTTPGALQPAGGSTYSGFVLKLNAAGSELVYSTFLGGRTGVGETAGNRVVVDATGNAYVAGKTQAEDFPTTPGAFQTKKAGFGGQADAFVSKLNPAGTGLVFSTFLGGANDESGDALAVDTAGNVYVAGLTRSMNFPVTPNAFQIVSGGTLTDEAFLTKLNPAGTAPVYSTYFGGNNTDQVRALFVDSQGNATLLGFTGSTDLPTTPGAYRRSKADSGSGFLSTFNASGETLLYSTFLPSLSDAARDAQGRFYLLALPYITGFDASTSSIMYQTQLTGGIPSGGNSAIAADSAGNAFVTGFTDSVNFPVTPGSYQTSLRLGTFRRADAFVAKISAVPSPPVLQSLSPSSGIPASFISTLQLTVLGRDFEPNSVVTWDGIERKTTFVTIGELQASIPASELTSATPHDVRVTTPGLGTSDAVTFGVRDAAVPAIRSLVPSLVRAGAPAAFVRVLGSGFTGNSVVRINGEARTTTFPLQGELDVILPAADIAAVGSLRLEVFTPPPGGGLSNAVNFSVVATPDPPVVGVPAITELSPASVPALSDRFSFTVRGSGFVSGRSVIYWNDESLPTTFVNANTLNGFFSTVPSEGPVTISVRNTPPGGGTSNALLLRIQPPAPNSAPRIESLSQSSAAAGGPGFTLTVRATNAVKGTKILWNGSERPTTLSNDSFLTAPISAADVASPGRYYLTIWSPGPGGGSSNALSFTVFRDVILNVQTSDLVYDPLRRKIYVSRPAISRTDRNSVSQIDPETGLVERSVPIGNEPGKLALSDDSSTLYVVFDQGRSVRRLDVASFTAGLQFTLDPADLVQDIQVLPGQPNSVAISQADSQASPQRASVAVYDNGVRRPKTAVAAIFTGAQPSTVSTIRFAGDATRLYGCSQNLPENYLWFAIDATGVSISRQFRAGYCAGFEIMGSSMYVPTGGVIDLTSASDRGTHPVYSSRSSLVRPDPAGRTIYVSDRARNLQEPGAGGVANIDVFDEQTFALVGSFVVRDVPASISSLTTISSLARWGHDGIAFATVDGHVHLINLPPGFLSPVYATYFPHFAHGNEYTSSLILTNPSPSEAAHGNVSFFRDDGFAQSVPVPGDSGVTTIAFAIPPLGSTTVALAPDSLSLLTGAARVTTNIPISGVVRFGSTNLGIAGVGDSRPAAAMIVPAVRDSAKGMNTGVAIHNTNSQAVEFGLTLRTMTGANIPGGYRSLSLPPHGHMGQFIHELFPTAATTNFQGTLVLNSMTPGTTLSAVALQLGGTPGQFTTMPVVPIQSATGTTELVFPHLASGDGISSSLFLLNASGGAIHGSVQSFGDSGVPIIPSGPFSINQGGGALVEASGQSTLNTGWGKVTSDGPAGGVVRFSIPGLGIAGVGAAQTGSGFIAPVSRSEASSFSTGVALISTETTTNLTLTLRDQGGLLVPGGEVQLTVPANGHVAKFIHELFPQSDTREFVGSLSVASANGPIAGVVIQLGGRPGEFTTLPVVPLR